MNSSQIVQKVGQFRQAAAGPKVRPFMLAGTAALFVGIVWVTIRNMPEDVRLVHPMYLVFTGLVLVPLTASLNALEYRASAKLIGHHVPLRDAFSIAVFSSAANLLPVPGAVVIRTRALQNKGADTTSAVSSTAVAGALWIAATGLLGGTLLFFTGFFLSGAVFLALGISTASIAAGLAKKKGTPGKRATFFRLTAIEFAFVFVSGLRFLVILRALGNDAGVAQATALTAAAVLASAIGIFPSGLGIREALSGLIGATVQLGAAIGVLVTAIDRILGLIVLAIFSLVLAVVNRKPLPQ